MSDINYVTVVGRLTRDPEIRFAPTGMAVATFSVATNHRYQDKGGQWKDEAAFIPCAAFGNHAEQLAQKHKGEPVLATGRLRTESWNRDGVNHSRLILVIETVHSVVYGAKSKDASAPTNALPDSEEARKAVPF